MYTFIETIEDLSFLNEELLKKPFVAVDTEFRRTHKDNMRLALLQVNDAEETFLIDTVAIENPIDNCNFLFSKSVKKIFHSCKEDLEAIYSWTNCKMTNIFDTQLANALLDRGYSISYQDLVNQKLGIILEKKETRSNWIRRPLSDDQLKYAALDVEYLIYLYEGQAKALSSTKKLDWHDQDIEKLIDSTLENSNHTIRPLRLISRAQENEILNKFNKLILSIADREKINPTLFFSKKAQKDFLRSVLEQGFDVASKQITEWRAELIRNDFMDLLT